MDSLNGVTATESHTVVRDLRLELKDWEQSFAAAHQGRKAGRADIKQHPDIAHKYKLYDRLRRPSSKRHASHRATPSKERSPTTSHPVPSFHSPYKRQKYAHTIHPATTQSHPPSPRHLSPMILHTSIGPTPQKDGQVLGLFDQHSAPTDSQTPSKRKVLQSVGGNFLATPSKHPRSKGRMDMGEMPQESPLNNSQSRLQEHLRTPPTRRTTNCSTPATRSAIANPRFQDTPAFLRRDSQHAEVGKEKVSGDGEGVSWSPVVIRKLPKAAGRALSALVRGLWEMEDEGLDEELDILREMESEATSRNRSDQPKTFASDSQGPDMPLGPDGGLESDEDGVEYAKDGKGRDGKPLKVWKKKGQKRTTRRVLMKPNTEKWKPEPAWEVGQANRYEGDGDTETATVSAQRSTIRGCDSDEYEDIQESQGATWLGNGRKHAPENDLEKKKELPKKIKKKISATAHANFRALKIKNKQSKGGKFGRKR